MEVDKKSHGALMGAIIIIILLVLGALYVWVSKTAQKTEPEVNPATQQQETTPAATAETLEEIESELSIEDFDLEIEDIDSLE